MLPIERSAAATNPMKEEKRQFMINTPLSE
jgi:hypothetical protein